MSEILQTKVSPIIHTQNMVLLITAPLAKQVAMWDGGELSS